MDQARRGDAALAASNFEEAIKEYSSAISVHNRAPSYYIKRSTAYHRLQKFQEALDDAEAAVMLAHERAQREPIKDAQLRRALALFSLGRYADAEFILGVVKKLDPKEKTVPIWEMKVKNKLKEFEESDERRKPTAKEVPQVELPAANSHPTKEKEPEKEPAKGTERGTAEKAAAEAKGSPSVQPPAATATPANKVRHEFYDSTEQVVISVFAKGVPKDKLGVTIEKRSLETSFPTISGSDFFLNLEPLFAEVDPSTSTYRVTPTKIEITLKKVIKGQKWKVLEGGPEAPAQGTSTGSQGGESGNILASKANEQPPAYPTSSKKGVKNWDKVEDDGDEDDGDATAKFFKTLYAGATPEQQRAMMKSFQESGGTVLSTDWNQVGGKTVTPEPPEGMEAKKWGA